MAARFGLWMADLSVTQIQQENVEKGERGVIGGIQSSMNQIMDVAMFVLVLILPRAETFGILVIISFSSITVGAIFFISYGCGQEKLSCCADSNIGKSNETIITKL
jgi:iron-regulated transporter 1